jgi:hypothetical protein
MAHAIVRWVAGLGAACCVCSIPVAAQAPTAWVSGSVTVSPVRPGPQRPGDAGTAPFAGARVELRNARGAIVARGTSDAAGRFRLAAPAGDYEVHARARDDAILPRCEGVPVSLRPGQTAEVAIACDSGMR